jgi:hypothetical protein
MNTEFRDALMGAFEEKVACVGAEKKEELLAFQV